MRVCGSPPCSEANSAADGDLDQADFYLRAGCLTGPDLGPKNLAQPGGNSSIECHNDMTCKNAPGRTRTSDIRFRKPVPTSISSDTARTCESPSATPSNNPSSKPGNSTANVPDDPDLAVVTDAWPELPAAVRAGIVAMIQAAKT